MSNQGVRTFARVALLSLLFAGGPGSCSDSAGQTRATAGPEAEPAASFAVVELFTSEGCSSCPPADQLLSAIVADSRDRGRRVFPLAFHVDYWNRLGWKDPYSDRAYSRRQDEYRQAFKSDNNYTPQMVVNGTSEFVGSDRVKALREIGRALEREPASRVTLGTRSGGSPDVVVVRYAVAPVAPNAVLNLALVERNLTSKVRRGENGGRTLRHDNVVRVFRTHPLGDGGSAEVELTLPTALVSENALVVAYVQDSNTKRVLGADATDLPATTTAAAGIALEK